MKTYRILLILLIELVTACAPAPTLTAVSQTGIAPTITSPIAEFQTADLNQGSAEQPAGKFRTPAWFGVPFEFETTKSYRGGGKSSEQGQVFALERGENSLGNATHRLVFFAFPSDVSGMDSMGQLRATQFLDSEGVQEIAIPNMIGSQWDAVAGSNPAEKSEVDVAKGTISIPALYKQMRFEGTWYTATPEARLRFIMPDLPGHTVLIYLEAPATEFDEWTKETEELLKTVTFTAEAAAVGQPTSLPKSDSAAGKVWGEPAGVLAIDGQDNVYVLREDLIIYKYDPSGNLIMQWGGMGSEAGQFNDRVGSYSGIDMAVDAQGNVYVADFGNFRIQKFDSNGKFLKQWGSQGSEPGQFMRAWALAVDPGGNVYVADEATSRIQKFDSDGNFLTQWGKPGKGKDEFLSIITVGADTDGYIYVGDYFLQQVKKFDNLGNLITTWNSCGANTSEGSIRPVSFAFDQKNNVYMMDSVLKKICIYSSDGKLLASWGGSGKEIGKFDFYEGGADLAIDSQGNLYVSDGGSDYGNDRIQKLQPAKLNTN